jgi:dynein heavy chain
VQQGKRSAEDCAVQGAIVWRQSGFNLQYRAVCSVVDEHVWLVLDGPIDSHLVESLNPALDENRFLSLANGDRISMSQNCRIVFEAENIDNISPSTLSRCGVVCFNSYCLDWRTILGVSKSMMTDISKCGPIVSF